MNIAEKTEQKKEYERKIEYVRLFNKGIAGIETQPELFLSKFYKEKAEDFDQRFTRSRLSNYVNKSYEQIKGHLLQSKVEWNEKEFAKYPNLQAALENMDGKGTKILEFIVKAVEAVIIEGSLPYLIDFNNFSGLQTKENAEKAVPKFLMVENSNFINYQKKEGEVGKELSSFVFCNNKVGRSVLNTKDASLYQESTKEIFVYYKRVKNEKDTGYTEDPINMQESVFLAKFVEDEKADNSESETPKYRFYGEMEIQVNDIPVEFLNFNKKDSVSMFEEVPPLFDLARLNGALFRNESSQTEILRTSRFAIFASTGTGNEPPEGISPNQWLDSKKADAKYYVVEISGRAINAGKEDVEIAKKTLEDLQLDFLNGRGTTNIEKTATESVINQSNSLSKIEIYAQEIESFLNRIFNVALNWNSKDKKSVDFGFKVTLDDVSFINSDNKKLLLEGYKSGVISKYSCLKILKKYKLFDEEFDIEEEIQRINEESEEPTRDMLDMTKEKVE